MFFADPIPGAGPDLSLLLDLVGVLRCTWNTTKATVLCLLPETHYELALIHNSDERCGFRNNAWEWKCAVNL